MKDTVITVIGAQWYGEKHFVKTISGLVPVASGEIWFSGKRINGESPTNIVKLGVVQVPEGRKLFPYLSVNDNLKLGATLRRDRADIEKDMEEIFTHFPILQKRSKQAAGTLSGGEQQMWPLLVV